MSIVKQFIYEHYKNNSYFSYEEIYEDILDWNDILLTSEAFFRGNMFNIPGYVAEIEKIIDEQSFIDDLIKINNLGLYPCHYQNFKYQSEISYLEIYLSDSNLAKQIFKYLLIDDTIFTYIQSPTYYYDNFEDDRFGIERVRFDPNDPEHQNETRVSKDGKWFEPGNWWRHIYSDHKHQPILSYFIEFDEDSEDEDQDEKDEGCGIEELNTNQTHIEYLNAYKIFSNTTSIGIYCKSFEEDLSAPKILLDIIEKYNIQMT